MSGSEDTDLRIIRAKNAEKCERYLDMAIAMKDYVKSEKGLSTDHRNLLSVAYKNVVGARRSSWRVISSIENKDGGEGQTQNGPDKAQLAKGLREKVTKELEDICSEVLELLDKYLIDKANTTPEANIFYCKMKGDYYRYLAEVCTDKDNKDKIIKESEEAYIKAFEEAKVELKPTDPIRLGLALNFSVFHFEIKEARDKACELAKAAFDDAITELDQVEETCYKDSTLIMQLLRDNLTLWQSESSQDERDGD